jgi:hypothetical protein
VAYKIKGKTPKKIVVYFRDELAGKRYSVEFRTREEAEEYSKRHKSEKWLTSN